MKKDVTQVHGHRAAQRVDSSCRQCTSTTGSDAESSVYHGWKDAWPANSISDNR